jgi:hypothetical protein
MAKGMEERESWSTVLKVSVVVCIHIGPGDRALEKYNGCRIYFGKVNAPKKNGKLPQVFRNSLRPIPNLNHMSVQSWCQKDYIRCHLVESSDERRVMMKDVDFSRGC